MNNKKSGSFLFFVILTIATILSVTILIASRLFIVLSIRDASMIPSLCPGDLILVRIKNFDNIERKINLLGKLVVFANKEKRLVVKRIYALPSDVVQYSRALVVGPEVSSRSYPVCTNDNSHSDFQEAIVHVDEVFLAGDNLLSSTDSRSFGPVPVNSLVGVVSIAIPIRLRSCTCAETLAM